MFLANVSFFKKLKQRNSAWSASFTYFNAGNINLSRFDDEIYTPQGTERPHEFFADFGYALRLSERFSMAVTARYLRSELSVYTQNQRNTAFSFASDIAGFYTSDLIPYMHFYGKYRFGFQIANIGAKVKYADFNREFFLPTTLKLGGSYDFVFDSQNTLTLSVEAKKLLVPTPPKYGFTDNNNNGKQDANEPTFIISGYDPNVSFLKGIFQSFYDAPDGFLEEMEEVSWSAGITYTFNDVLTLNLGYFRENPRKGSRNFLAIGTEFLALRCDISLAYLFSFAKEAHPLEKALRISIGF